MSAGKDLADRIDAAFVGPEERAVINLDAYPEQRKALAEALTGMEAEGALTDNLRALLALVRE